MLVYELAESLEYNIVSPVSRSYWQEPLPLLIQTTASLSGTIYEFC